MALKKDISRFQRYVVLIFMTEFVRVSASKRRAFLGRALRRLARLLGLFQAGHFTIDLWRTLSDRFWARPESERQDCYPLWRRATSGLDNRLYLRSWIKRRYEGGPKIVVLGAGSVGDILQITPVLRALRQKVPVADICLLHLSPAARQVLQGNMNVNSIGLSSVYHIEKIKAAVRDEGAADLVVEIESVSYIITYTPAPLSLRHPDLNVVFPDTFFVTAAAEQELWKRHPPIFPRRDASFVWPSEWKNFHYLDVLGTTGALPIDRHSPLDFFSEPGDAEAARQLTPERPYVTVQSGVDTVVTYLSRIVRRRPTKLLPAAILEEAVRMIQAENLAVVQLGTDDDDPIQSVDIDLRGRTTFRQAAAILKAAECHVGTEGGLVHLAHAMDVRSVVAFGPTSKTFLGYPQNVNLVAADCIGCWWTTKDWYIYCPRGLTEPECMTSFTANMIVGPTLAMVFKAHQRKH